MSYLLSCIYILNIYTMLRDKNLKRFSVLLFPFFFLYQSPLTLLYLDVNKLSISFGSLILENHSNANEITFSILSYKAESKDIK